MGEGKNKTKMSKKWCGRKFRYTHIIKIWKIFSNDFVFPFDCLIMWLFCMLSQSCANIHDEIEMTFKALKLSPDYFHLLSPFSPFTPIPRSPDFFFPQTSIFYPSRLNQSNKRAAKQNRWRQLVRYVTPELTNTYVYVCACLCYSPESDEVWYTP